jgi:hypothetical protein
MDYLLSRKNLMSRSEGISKSWPRNQFWPNLKLLDKKKYEEDVEEIPEEVEDNEKWFLDKRRFGYGDRDFHDKLYSLLDLGSNDDYEVLPFQASLDFEGFPLLMWRW